MTSLERDRARLSEFVARIGPLDARALEESRKRQDSLTKPPGSLGRLERLATQLAAITGDPRPRLPHKAVIIMAADHGVAREGVSAYPQQVTAQMVRNFANGGAAINVLARQAGARVVVVDIGVAADLPVSLPIVHRKVAFGTGNMAETPAMSETQVLEAIGVGLDVVASEAERGLDVVCLGDMGIANTTAASAIVASITGRPVPELTGRGTGIDDATWMRKVSVIHRALELHKPDPAQPLDVLAKVGGLEIAGLVGVTLAAASRRIAVILDGFIASAAALIAVELCCDARSFLIAAHRSVEIGHTAILERLELEPLVALDMRLGEGSGAALVLPMLDAATALLDEMATFEEAGVANAREATRKGAQHG
jgi:nicotinate-nucleotide--dimethylbenzimidazole phosphoribosyltransferase